MVALADAEREGGFNAQKISPEKAVADRSFPVFLICDANDRRIPCRHSRRIYDAAAGPKEIWVVPGAGHTMAFGTHPEEFESRVIGFFERIASQLGVNH